MDYPHFENKACGYLRRILAEISELPESEIEARREARKLEYLRLVTIPGAIRAERLALNGASQKEISRLLHDEALMCALVVGVYLHVNHSVQLC